MRIWFLSAALCLGFLLSPSWLGAAAPTSEEVVARWHKALESQNQMLREQEWRRAAKGARDLVEEMVEGVLAGEGSAQLLASAVAQQAVAEAGLGHQDEAVWLWHLAQNLDPRMRRVTLGAYGPVGKALGLLQLRQPGKAPAGGPDLPADGSFEPPRVLRQEDLRTPRGLAAVRVAADVEVEMIVRPDGQIVEPVLLTVPEYPSLAFVVLQSLRGWRFAPAQAAGVAVPALFRTRISHPGLRAAAEKYPDNQQPLDVRRLERQVLEQKLVDLDARLRRGEWQAVHAPALDFVSRLREAGLEGAPLAEGLRVLALAEAGMGSTEEAIWHWQVAQSLRPKIELDPAAYGEAGRLLAGQKLRKRDEPPAGMEVVSIADLGTDSVPPRKIEGEELAVTGFLALPQTRKWTRLQVVIDTEGRAVAPVTLGGGPAALRWTALETVRAWRFEPARRGGQPVAVFLDITLPTSTETPLAKMVPLTDHLGSLHELLLSRQWAKAHNRAERLIDNLVNESDLEPRQAAAALAFLALAEAGSGDPATAACYWQGAQGFYSDLYHADLAAYDTAGALLEASNPWMQPITPIAQFDPSGGDVLRPEKISGRGPQYTDAARMAGLTGEVIVESIIGEDGRVYQPRVLKALPLGLDLTLLYALCEWRFKPATYQGRPVKVYYTLTTNFTFRQP
jgi:TonB family protein